MSLDHSLSCDMHDDGVAFITIARSPGKTMDVEILSDLVQMSDWLAENKDVKALVSAGGLKVFQLGWT